MPIVTRHPGGGINSPIPVGDNTHMGRWAEKCASEFAGSHPRGQETACCIIRPKGLIGVKFWPLLQVQRLGVFTNRGSKLLIGHLWDQCSPSLVLKCLQPSVVV